MAEMEAEKQEKSTLRSTWKLEDIYPGDYDWEKEVEAVGKSIPALAAYKGNLQKSSNLLLEALKARDELLTRNDMLFFYAKLRRDKDNTDHASHAMVNKARALGAEVHSAISYFDGEIASIHPQTLQCFYEKETSLGIYRRFIDTIIRKVEHAISPRDRMLLQLFDPAGTSYIDIYTKACNVDMEFVSIKNENGELVSISKSNVIKYLDDKDRQIREQAYHAILAPYVEKKELFAGNLISQIKRNVLIAKASRYCSALESAMDKDSIPLAVYDNLIETVGRHLTVLHSYVGLKRQALNLDKFYIYDLNVPLLAEKSKHISFEDAVEIVENALLPLGDDYVSQVKIGLCSGWVDVYPRKGKTSGNFSWGTYGMHPFILLNFNGALADAFNLIHEMGHAMYNFYSCKNQPYVYSQPGIFVSEVVALVNEVLLMNYLLSKTRDKDERVYLLSYYINIFIINIFRSTMYAELEKNMYQSMENGVELTRSFLDEQIKNLYTKFYGSELLLVDGSELEWATVQHLYNNFYIYKYATGLSAALFLGRKIFSGDKVTISLYHELLSKGSSETVLEILKKTGVDLSMRQPVEDAMHEFGSLLNELERLLKEV